MKILKFGGTSVGSPDRIRQIIEIIKDLKDIVVVVSAFGGVTDQLIKAAKLAKSGDKEYLNEYQEIENRHLEAIDQLVATDKKEEAQNHIKEELKELKQILHGIYLIKEISPRSMDLVMSFGERLSAYIIAQATQANFLDTRQVIKTDENFNYAKVAMERSHRNIKEYFGQSERTAAMAREGNVARPPLGSDARTSDGSGSASPERSEPINNQCLHIATGFIATTDNNETTTLGRGGSDYTASILGAALDAEEIQIWTDVDGIMTADPRKAKKAFTIDEISYQEAMEMSHFGAKVIHPPTMQPALSKNIPIRIKNTLNPDFPGSLISASPKQSSGQGERTARRAEGSCRGPLKGSDARTSEGSGFASPECSEPINKSTIKGVSSIGNITLLTLQGSGIVGVAGIAQRLFGSLAKEKISVILITQASSEHCISFAIKPEETELAERAINEEFALEIEAKKVEQVIVEKELAIVAIVGENMRKSPGTSGKMFHTLGKNGINVIAIAQGSSELNISAVIPRADETKAINALHDALFLSGTKSINVFLVGTGLIGSTLLKQIEAQTEHLKNRKQIELNIIATANSREVTWHSSKDTTIEARASHSDAAQRGEESGSASSEPQRAYKKMDLSKFIAQMVQLNLPNSVFVDCTASEDVAKHYKDILKESISIVTPNKKASSNDYSGYKTLKDYAAKYNVKFLYETNVGAGLPVLSTLNDLRDSGDNIQSIEGVLSGTLSYIFNSFTGEKPFSEVVKEAQEKGYTEPDPREDLNGLDVARKILILAREAGLEINLNDVDVENLVPEDCRETASVDERTARVRASEGSGSASPERYELTIKQFFAKLKTHDQYFSDKQSKAAQEGKKLCYIATLKRDQNQEQYQTRSTTKIAVKLEAVDQDHPFYSLSGSDNIISFTSARYNERPLVIKGPGAGAEVTAGGVFADIIRIASS